MKKTICVIGLGYIGLPTASLFAIHDHPVVGVDVNEAIVNILRNGDIYIEEPGLKTVVKAALSSGNLRVTTKVEPADTFIIAVPTPIHEDKTAGMQFVISATESVVPVLRAGNLVILESTSPPRTTVDLVCPILERSGLKAGKDFLLAYSPERVLPGQILHELVENARVIGGIDDASAQAGRDLYASFVQGEIILTDATTAEMVKLMENTYRDVNIAIANEFLRLADRFGVNIWEAVEVANRHPRVRILNPGPGVGGHCISVDPWFFVEAAPDLAQLIHVARLVNDGQPAYVITRLEQALGNLAGKTIALLGLAYKANVDDMRESPAIEVALHLLRCGVVVRAFDPYAKNSVPALDGVLVESAEEAVQGADALVLLVDHHDFNALNPAALAGLMKQAYVFDTRNVLRQSEWKSAGFQFQLLGNGKQGSEK